MEWVETTAKTLDEAREAALDQLGVGARRRRVRHPRRAQARAVRPRPRRGPAPGPGPSDAGPSEAGAQRKSRSDKPASTRTPSVKNGKAARPRRRRATLEPGRPSTAEHRRPRRRRPATLVRTSAPDRQRSSKQREQVTAVSHDEAVQSDGHPGRGGCRRRCVHGRPDRGVRHARAPRRSRVDGTVLELNVAGDGTRPAGRPGWAHAERGPGSRPCRRAAPARRPRDPPAHRHRRLPRPSRAGARQVLP